MPVLVRLILLLAILPGLTAPAGAAQPAAAAPLAPVLAAGGAGVAGPAAADPVDVAIARRLIDERRTIGDRPVILPLLRRLYAQRGFQPLWIAADGRVRPGVLAALAVFRGADRDGLTPVDYHVEAIAERLGVPAGAELELLVTDAVVRYATHLQAGRVPPRTISADLAVTPAAPDAVEVATAAAQAPDIAAFLAGFVPRAAGYESLREALARLRAVETAGGWPAVPPPRTAKLEPGQRDPAVRALRQRLAAAGDADLRAPAGPAADLYDPALRKAVARFQERHGLAADGTVGASTLAALNVPLAARINQVTANLERLRWMPAELGARHVIVNVPDYSLKAVADGRVVEQMRVIVGTKVRRTPIFSSTITSVVLNPTWTVPARLAREDYLPKLLKDPGYLAAKGFTVYSHWGAGAVPLDQRRINWKAVGASISRLKLRQDPGPNNALGQVKFNIPNDFAVYLHDTPGREKFGRAARAFSSGCVRVGDPMALAAFVLAGTPEWPEERRQQVLDSLETRTLLLKEPVPVHLLYRTAWVDEAGALQFRDDVYGRDAELLEAVARRSAAGTKLASLAR